MKTARIISLTLIIVLGIISIVNADSLQIQSFDNGHWYQRIDSNMSWQDAKTYADGLGGYLATITSQNEQDFIWSNLGATIDDFIWLGGTDEVVEGTWKWVTGETFWIGLANGYPVDNAYTNWAYNTVPNDAEPDNIGRGQDYLAFFPVRYGHNGGWDDFGLPDYNHLQPFIVEWNPTSVPEPSTILLIGSGLVGIIASRRYFKKQEN